MKSRWSAKIAAIFCAICLAVGVMCQSVFARDDAPAPERYTAEKPESTFVILGEEAIPTEAPEVTDNRLTIPLYMGDTLMAYCSMVNGEPYMGAADFCQVLGLPVQTLETDGVLTVVGEGFELSAREGQNWFICNDRYLYARNGVFAMDGAVSLPVEQMVRALGVNVSWDRVKWCMTVDSGKLAPLASGDTFYNDSDVLWLSRLIFAMAADESLDAQLGVGNVCVNRLHNEAFAKPANIYEVVTAKNQFSVVSNGMIYATPTENCVIAAKLALEGWDVTHGATYVNTGDLGTGYECVAQMGQLRFFTAA